MEPPNVDHKSAPEDIAPMLPPNVDHKPTLEEKASVEPPNVDHKPTLEEKVPVEPPNVDHKPTLEEIAPMKPPNVDHKPTSEEKAPVEPPNVDHKPKAPPRFRIKPVKPRYLLHLAKKPIPAQPKRKTPGPPAYFHKLTAPAGPRRHLIRRAQNPHLIRRAQNPHLIRRAQTLTTPTPTPSPSPSPSPTVTAAPTPSPLPSPTETTAGGKRWCVAKADASDQVLQANIDYACEKGVDCKPIQKGGDCFDSTSLKSHASFVMNAFYNIHGRKNCHFGQSGVLTTTNPSYGNCTYI
ncbi:hypothetical protein LWI28_016626 [Acer negundo]|uniref:X8 domain-containing protein n=1 Tax=Acer negundo TaxID=4023 RepID=A0AAD5NGN0_ACENE|nr:hypothetical protein LWI28_016626 [Acer negundo]